MACFKGCSMLELAGADGYNHRHSFSTDRQYWLPQQRPWAQKNELKTTGELTSHPSSALKQQRETPQCMCNTVPQRH